MKDMKLMRLLGEICDYGVIQGQDPQLTKRVILSNKISLTLLSISFPPVFVHLFLDQKNVAAALFLMAVFFTLIPFINKAGFLRVSRFCLILIPCMSMFYFTETLGMKVGTHFFIFPLTCLAFVLFKWEERIYILSGAVIAISVLFFLLSRSDSAGSLALTHSAELILHITFSVLPVALMCSSLLYFLYGNHTAEASLRQSKESLESAHSQLKENQSQLLQAEKMASLGQLAAGVAHEINNPMGFIVSNVNTLSEYVNTLNSVLAGYQEFAASVRYGQPRQVSSPILTKVDELVRASDLEYVLKDSRQLILETQDGVCRVRDIVRNLRDFAEPDAEVPESVHVNECLEAALKVVWNDPKVKCTVERRFAEVPSLTCFRGQLNQVFLNLLNNAVRAIKEMGVITLRTEFDGEWVTVSVSDTGVGIAPENIPKLFTPFFTTRPVGQGMGLGLSVAYGIVKKHGGDIRVESKEGVGTCFSVRLPVIPSKVSAPSQVLSEAFRERIELQRKSIISETAP